VLTALWIVPGWLHKMLLNERSVYEKASEKGNKNKN